MWKDKNLIKYGLLESEVKENSPLERMEKMAKYISELLDLIKPDYVVLEQVQFQNNYRTYSQLSQMQGVIFHVLFERDLGFTLIEPTAWKSFSHIKGKARKEQKENTIQMVRDRYGFDVSEDEADAIGIGIWAVNTVIVEE